MAEGRCLPAQKETITLHFGAPCHCLRPPGLLCPQIPAAAFSLVTKDGQPVRYDMEVPDSGIDLQCTLAPDGSFAWSWRVKHGQLENRP